MSVSLPLTNASSNYLFCWLICSIFYPPPPRNDVFGGCTCCWGWRYNNCHFARPQYSWRNCWYQRWSLGVGKEIVWAESWVLEYNLERASNDSGHVSSWLHSGCAADNGCDLYVWRRLGWWPQLWSRCVYVSVCVCVGGGVDEFCFEEESACSISIFIKNSFFGRETMPRELTALFPFSHFW